MGESYIVTGFYTPDYEPLADVFRANLDAHGVPHHLYAVDRIGGTWLAQTLRKPQIVLRARADHPGATVILCDVDCQVSGPLEPLLSGEADVKLFFRPKVSKRKRGRHRDRALNDSDNAGINTSSRVLVVRQTPDAVRLIEAWRERCDRAIEKVSALDVDRKGSMLRNLGIGDLGARGIKNDESLLLDAIAATPGVTIEMLPPAFAGAAAGVVPGALITHDSALDKAQPAARVRNTLKRVRRRIVSAIVGKSYLEWKYGKASRVEGNWR